MRGGEVARVWRHDSRLREMCDRLVDASLERGRQMEELRMVPDGSVVEMHVHVHVYT